MLTLPTIRQVATTRPDLYAFRIAGEVSRDDMTQMARYMNDAFDTQPGKVDMMLIFDRFEGSQVGASMSWEAIKSRFKSLGHVNRYVVVGAPDSAKEMVESLGHLLPVKAETFDSEPAAWRELGAEVVADPR